MSPPSPTSLFTSVHILTPDEQTVGLTPASVKRVLSRIRHCKFTGLNNMDGCKLKGCVEQLKNLLTDVLNPCWPLEGTVVMTVSSTKFLEVHNADDLNWSINATASPRIPINTCIQHNVRSLFPTENSKNCITNSNQVSWFNDWCTSGLVFSASYYKTTPWVNNNIRQQIEEYSKAKS